MERTALGICRGRVVSADTVGSEGQGGSGRHALTPRLGVRIGNEADFQANTEASKVFTRVAVSMVDYDSAGDSVWACTAKGFLAANSFKSPSFARQANELDSWEAVDKLNID